MQRPFEASQQDTHGREAIQMQLLRAGLLPEQRPGQTYQATRWTEYLPVSSFYTIEF